MQLRARWWETWTASTTVGAPPTMFCNGANEAHWPQSWAGVGVACGSDLRWLLACTTMPSWANNSASDSTCTNQRRLRRIRGPPRPSIHSRAAIDKLTLSKVSIGRKLQRCNAPTPTQFTDDAASAAFSDVGASPE